jgi:hypothetical protein
MRIALAACVIGQVCGGVTRESIVAVNRSTDRQTVWSLDVRSTLQQELSRRSHIVG